MSPLQKSYADEYERILKRGTVWIRGDNGKWFHTHNRVAVSYTLKRLKVLATYNPEEKT